MFHPAWIHYWDLPDPMRWAIAIWLFAFGACAGSFMNVVIWRLPHGRSVVYPGSRCPVCGHAVRSYDNIPILNWLVLRGRCRDCGAGISWRYPAFEAFVALLFVVVAFAEPLREGGNLPRFPDTYNTSGMILLWIFYAEQMLLLSTLVCAAFMWFDGNRPPERLFAPLAVIGLFAPLFAPELRPEQLVDLWSDFSPRVAVATESLVGLILAAVVAAVTAATVYPRSAKTRATSHEGPSEAENIATSLGTESIPARFEWPFSEAMWEVGALVLVFGIPSTARIVAGASLLSLVATIAGRYFVSLRLIPWTAFLVPAAVLQIAIWKETVNWLQSATHGRPWIVVPAALSVTAAACVLVRILSRQHPRYAPGWNRDWPVN